MDPYHSTPARPQVDHSRLWAGGLATALVVMLLVAVMSWIVRDVLDIPELQRLIDDRSRTDGDLAADLVAAFVLTLVATLVLDVLLVTTPTPLRLFHWLIVLATVVAALVPLTRGDDTDSSVARAVGTLVVGLTISSLLTGVARRSYRPARPGSGPW
ncbi:MAG TPA: DUF6069 family protein [Iamia sp.]